MFRHAIAWLLIAAATTGCDRITGVADQKTSDAESIGYACRVSLKKPEDCMKENESQSTTAVLTGWKAADKDIQDKRLDPSMGSDPAYAERVKPASAPGATEEANPKGEESAPAADQPKASEKKPTKSN
ncbi:MAG: hypothetical protein Q7T38_07100 [Gallionella sp.]|nr:hypothetical protein [Gallionella sp.]